VDTMVQPKNVAIPTHAQLMHKAIVMLGREAKTHGVPLRQSYVWAAKQAAFMAATKAHAVVLMDGAGWHKTDKLEVPQNLTIFLLPSLSPELNPVENVWQYLRRNWLSNRVFETYEDIVDAGCGGWNRLIEQPQTIMSIGMRNWAHASQ